MKIIKVRTHGFLFRVYAHVPVYYIGNFVCNVHIWLLYELDAFDDRYILCDIKSSYLCDIFKLPVSCRDNIQTVHKGNIIHEHQTLDMIDIQITDIDTYNRVMAYMRNVNINKLLEIIVHEEKLL